MARGLARRPAAPAAGDRRRGVDPLPCRARLVRGRRVPAHGAADPGRARGGVHGGHAPVGPALARAPRRTVGEGGGHAAAGAGGRGRVGGRQHGARDAQALARAAEPGRLPRRRPVEARHVVRRLARAGHDRPAGRGDLRPRHRPGADRDAVGAGTKDPPGRRAGARGGRAMPHPARGHRDPARRRRAAHAGSRRERRGPAAPQTRGARPDRRRQLRRRAHRVGHRRRRVDRIGAGASGREARPRAAGAAGPGRERPARDRPGAARVAPGSRRRPRRRQRAGPDEDARRDAGMPARGGVPRRGAQAGAAARGEPRRGGAEQRRRHAHGGRGRARGRRPSVREHLHRQGRQPGLDAGGDQGDRRAYRARRLRPGGARPGLRLGALRQRAGQPRAAWCRPSRSRSREADRSRSPTPT